MNRNYYKNTCFRFHFVINMDQILQLINQKLFVAVTEKHADQSRRDVYMTHLKQLQDRELPTATTPDFLPGRN